MKSILLIGVNHFGSLLAEAFQRQGHQIMAIDKQEDRINAIMSYATDAKIGDSTNEEFLRSLGVENYDICIVTIGQDFQSSLETTYLLKQLGGRLVIARADREVQAKLLIRNGADDVINPERQVAQWAATRYASENILDYIKLDDNYAIFEFPVPKDWAGKSIIQIDIRKKYGITIMGIKEGGKINLAITPETVLTKDKSVLVLGDQKAIKKCFHL
ncbi:MAG: TrkA family potassium uptake protein [Sphaerochaetaceae bacterium]|nr:TrkA family potassium uptake protein [Sphaerochaetaceae bacterium]